MRLSTPEEKDFISHLELICSKVTKFVSKKVTENMAAISYFCWSETSRERTALGGTGGFELFR